jgi:multidrug efflux pump subunit AcrA (membrane-fusion protein)
MTRLTGPLITVVAALGVGCGGISSATTDTRERPGKEPKTPKDEIVLSPQEQATGGIQTEAVQSADGPVLLRVAGRIARADDRTWRVGVRTEGLVRSVRVNLGDAVKKDQVLARYHADEVREERANYRKAISELERAEAADALARRNYERAQSLLELKAGSVLQVDQARQDLVAADTALKRAQVEVDRTKDVLEDDLRVPVEPRAGDDESDLVPIIAPASGYIVEKTITPGRTIAPGQDAFVIADLSQVWMLASVSEEHVGELAVGQPATILVPGLSGARFAGRITNLGQEFDPATRVLPVRIVLNNPEQRLRPEMLANAEIPVGRSAPALTVPSDAVQQINGQDVVFVRTAPDRFVVRAVHTGLSADLKTPIVEGLTAGEEVVVHGSFVLKSHLLKSTMESE